MKSYYTGKHAAHYNQIWKTFSQKTLSAAAAVLDGTVRAGLAQSHKPVLRILDAGCGTGLLLERLSHLFPSAELYGIDSSQEMLAQAQQRLHQFATMHLACVQLSGDAKTALPYPPAFFDLITCTNVLHYFKNPLGVLSHFKTMLAEQGHLVLEDYDLRGFPFPWKWFAWAIPLYDPEHQRLFSLQAAQQVCQQAGLQVMTAQRFPIDLFCQGWIVQAM